MTGEREYLGDARIYGVPHMVYATHASVPEREVEPYVDEETGEEHVGFTLPPAERVEIEFSSLPLSHETGYTTEIMPVTWNLGYDELRRAVWSAVGQSAWEQVHKQLVGHPMLFSAQAAERAVQADRYVDDGDNDSE